ncbi:hypothetical protein P245_20895 [Comamonas thiooxydans]|uniref:Uncharacterized protein n=1 Tax=Comamonas thiooxydans TaxID=363952 RepID=A0A0E3BAP4_9BURK|nr:hypothetical protein P245_20895 [Comamonas thiooxydans]
MVSIFLISLIPRLEIAVFKPVLKTRDLTSHLLTIQMQACVHEHCFRHRVWNPAHFFLRADAMGLCLLCQNQWFNLINADHERRCSRAIQAVLVVTNHTTACDIGKNAILVRKSDFRKSTRISCHFRKLFVFHIFLTQKVALVSRKAQC